MKEYQKRFVLFARAQGMTPEEAERDPKCGMEYITWINQQWRDYYAEGKRERPELITDAEHAAFDKWLEARIAK